ncbi:MAG: universal stress protein [Cyanophyceae cyanobacterium]
MKKILVAIDRSSTRTVVFEQALSIAKATGATVMLLHVLSNQEKNSPTRIVAGYYEPILNDAVEELYQKQWQAFEQEGVELLRSFSERAIANGVSAETTQLYGNPSRQICELALNWEADLIVIGRRGLSGLKELLLGSVSNYVVHHAPCSVMVVHPPLLSETDLQPESALTPTES